MKTHPIIDHKTAEEVLTVNMSFEDPDSMLMVGIARQDGGFSGALFWKQEWSKPKETLVEMIYDVYGPDCECREAYNE
tara:strand:- start:190 stop:423 length:234 start_codon:yes stop_codon:yes gene_type:complete